MGIIINGGVAVPKKIYLNGSVVPKKVLLNGTVIWSDTPTFLYSWGNQNTDYTGGWSNCYPYGLYFAEWWNGTYVSTPNWGGDYVEFPLTGYPSVKTIITNKQIDFSGINKLTLTGSGITNYQLHWVIALTNGNGGTVYKWVHASSDPNPGTNYVSGRDGVVVLDTSDFNGMANVAMGAFQNGDGGDATLLLRSLTVN